MTTGRHFQQDIIISLGSNVSGPWGDSKSTLLTTISEIRKLGIDVTYVTAPVLTRSLSISTEPEYVNAVVQLRTSRSLCLCLKQFQGLERKAGRRPKTRRWAPRPLDIDIIAQGSRVIGWPPSAVAWSRFTLPHAQMHRRSFVLTPLCEFAHDWRHPVFDATAETLLARIGKADRLGLTVGEW